METYEGSDCWTLSIKGINLLIRTFTFCVQFWACIINMNMLTTRGIKDIVLGFSWDIWTLSGKIYGMSIFISVMYVCGTNNHSALALWLDHKLNTQIIFASPQPWEGMLTQFLKKCHKMCFHDYFNASWFEQLL